jgi:2-polyprenyl-6-methoxyphenol hydroxylase-like FAD-dependent oxidoreductase
MKIIIVGAGISGLTTYLFFTKLLPSDPAHPHQITVYESHHPRASNTALQDADISIASLTASTTIVGGGLGIQPNGMRVLRELNQELHDKVVAQGFPVERYTFKNAWGWTLSYMRGHDGRNPPERSVMSSREGIWKVLRDAVPDEAIVYRHVSGVSTDASGKPMVSFTDGSPDVQADILIGADGVWSKVKEAVLEDKQKYRPIYE